MPVHITGLDDELRLGLLSTLDALSCHESSSPQSAEIVFCDWNPTEFARRLAEFSGRPIVVVSRSTDVSAWLDALEAGAADYCAPPFEPTQIRWILDALLQRKSRSAAA
ncbi:MAG: hypothetical protein IH602_09700 [Bryobacteraceae bacterium]|nr:hypothetical protein [Bryobacteraceae bacterium]